MHFQKLTWQDAACLRSFLPFLTGRECDPTPGCLMMWRDFCRMKYHTDGNSLYICLHDDSSTPHYALPISRDHAEAVQRLVKENKGSSPMCFTTIPESHVPMFEQLYPGCTVTPQRDYADYLYRAESLVTMAGRKLSGQRNQMSQFRRNHPDWSFEPVTPSDVPAVIAFLKENFILDPSMDPVKRTEDLMALDMLEHLDDCPLSGGMLTAEGHIFGFAFGEIIRDTLYVHIEKALRDEKGAYQMVVNHYSAMYAGDSRVQWINREDDNGDPGLRKTKLSYLPDRLLNNYLITIP